MEAVVRGLAKRNISEFLEKIITQLLTRRVNFAPIEAGFIWQGIHSLSNNSNGYIDYLSIVVSSHFFFDW